MQIYKLSTNLPNFLTIFKKNIFLRWDDVTRPLNFIEIKPCLHPDEGSFSSTAGRFPSKDTGSFRTVLISLRLSTVSRVDDAGMNCFFVWIQSRPQDSYLSRQDLISMRLSLGRIVLLIPPQSVTKRKSANRSQRTFNNMDKSNQCRQGLSHPLWNSSIRSSPISYSSAISHRKSIIASKSSTIASKSSTQSSSVLANPTSEQTTSSVNLVFTMTRVSVGEYRM